MGVLVPAFVALGWWQLHRALSGNTLSWFYTFEWPFFAAYAVYVWWKLLHDDGTGVRTRRAPDPTEDARLEEYNRYLAQLSAEDRPKTWRR